MKKVGIHTVTYIEVIHVVIHVEVIHVEGWYTVQLHVKKTGT